MKGLSPVHLLLLSVTALWGFATIAFKLGLREIDPLPLFAARGVIACLLSIGMVSVFEKNWYLRRSDLPRLTILALAGVTANQLFFMTGLAHTTAANASLLDSTSPIFGLALGVLLVRERSSLRQWLGSLLGFLGAALIVVGGKAGQLSFGLDSLGGDLLVLSAAASWALYAVLARAILGRYSPGQLTAYTMLIGLLAGAPFAIGPALTQSWTNLSPAGWIAIAFAGIVMPLTTTIWNRGVAKIGASSTLVFMYMLPVFTVVFAVILLDEALTLLQIAGGAAVLSGVYIARHR